MNRNHIITAFFLALLVFVLYQTILLFSPFSSAIFWSAILAFSFYPLYKKVRKIYPPKEGLIALFMTLFIICVVAPPVIILIVNLASQAVELYQAITSYIKQGKLEHLIDQMRAIPFIQKAEIKIFQWEPLKENATTWVLNASRQIANFSIAQAGTFTKNIFVMLLNAGLMCILIFIFLKDGEKIYQFIYQIAPLEEDNKKIIFTQVNETFAAVIRGQLLTSILQALIAGLAYWALGLQAPIFFGLVVFLGTLIPFIGAAGIWIPTVIYLFIQHDVKSAVVLVIVGIFISTVDNIVKPALIGQSAKLPYFLLFFGILGGISAYGLMGIFLGPLVLSIFFILIKIYREQFLHKVL
jgi:predicted PurR-regulated permease PerM